MRIVDMFKDYQQILSHGMPPIETFAAPKDCEEFCKIINDGFVEICAKHPDHFPGYVAQVSLASPDAGVREAERAIKELGALGVQIYTNVNDKPLDLPEYEPFFAKMAELGKPVWLHPNRTAKHADYIGESKSLYEIWWTFGWSYESAAAMGRLVMSKVIDRNPNLKMILHHFGGIIPMLEGRIGPGWDQLGARTSDEDYSLILKRLKKRPFDYFKGFYGDTALAGARGPTICGIDFFTPDHVLFASDCPFDPEKGTMYPRLSIAVMESLELPRADLEKICFRNAISMFGLKG
jgi:aminocarboxymuconate-semialdehyde decarboxylase